MPTYDYRCEKCKHEFEAFQSITAAPLKKCPKCAKQSLRRLIGTGAALLFKGDGFYITDYRSEKYKEAAKADSGAAAGESKTETKPADAKADKKETKPAEAKSAEAKPAAKEPSKSASKSHKKSK